MSDAQTALRAKLKRSQNPLSRRTGHTSLIPNRQLRSIRDVAAQDYLAITGFVQLMEIVWFSEDPNMLFMEDN